MNYNQFQELLNKIGSYDDNYQMTTDMLNADVEEKFLFLCAFTHLLSDEDTTKQQMMLFAKIVSDDLSQFEGDEKVQLYNAVTNSTFDVIDRKDSYDIGCDHDAIHAFLIDRLDLA